MAELWTWDETLFAGTAVYYDRGRLPYSPYLADAVRDALGLDDGGRLLDVGCGPGTVALRLAGLFADVVGVDADSGMVEEARRLAAERNVTNASWVRMRAEDLPAGLGKFRLITFAHSFHWMDRPRVAAAVLSMLDPDGALIHVDSHYQDGLGWDDSLPNPPVPEDAIRDLVRSYVGPHRRAGQSICPGTPDDEDLVFRSAGFVGPECVEVLNSAAIERSTEDVVADTLSTSWSAPHLFGDRIYAFEADLRALLARVSPSGLFSVRLPSNELKIWRPRDGE
jgi:SAM-dependent methyltransferase